MTKKYLGSEGEHTDSNESAPKVLGLLEAELWEFKVSGTDRRREQARSSQELGRNFVRQK